MEKALKLYDDDYGRWRTNFEFWRFNYLDGNLKHASDFVKSLRETEPNYPQTYLADLITTGSQKKKASKSKKKLQELVDNNEDAVDNTDEIRKIKHSELRKNDINTLLKIKSNNK